MTPTVHRTLRQVLTLCMAAICGQVSAAGWIPITNGIPVNQWVASLVANSDTVVVATGSGAIFVSRDPDLAFTESVALMAGESPTARKVFLERGLVLAAPAAKANRSPLYFSGDFGSSWKAVEGLPLGSEVLSVVSHGDYFVVNTADDFQRNIPGSIFRSTNLAGPWEEVAKLPCSFLAVAGDQLFPMFGKFRECYVIGGDGVPRLTGLATHQASQQAVTFKGRLYTGVVMSSPQPNRAYMAWLDSQSLEWKTSSHIGLPPAVYPGLATDGDSLYAASSTDVMVTSDGLRWAALDVLSPPRGMLHLAKTGGNRLLAGTIQASPDSPSLFYLPLNEANLRAAAPAFRGLERRNIEVLERETVRIQPQVEGTAPMTFQWERGQVGGGFASMPGATNEQLVLTGVTKAEAGVYRLTASNALGTAQVETTLYVSSRRLGGFLTQPSFYSLPGPLVSKLLVRPDGKFYSIGGAGNLGHVTNRLGGGFDSSVNRFHPDGTKDTTFYCTNFGFSGSGEILQEPGGKLIIDGSFFGSEGQFRQLGRVDSMGRPDDSFVSPITSGTVARMGFLEDKSILVGGRMTLAGRGNREFFLIRLNPDGSFRSEFPEQGGGPNGAVQSLLRLDDGKWLVGGMISAYSRVPVPRLVRVMADGSLDRTFTAPTNMTLAANLVALQKDGKILVGVSELPPGPQPSPGVCIVRLNPDGTLDNSFAAACTTGGVIHALVVGEGGWVYVAGSFTKAGGIPRNSVARFHPDGRLDQAFEVKSAAGLNTALAFTPEGHLLIAGTIADPEVPKNTIMAVYTHLSTRARLTARTGSTAGQLEFLLEGSAGDSYRIQQSSDLQNWSDHSVLKLEGTQGRITVDSTKPRLWLRAISD